MPVPARVPFRAARAACVGLVLAGSWAAAARPAGAMDEAGALARAEAAARAANPKRPEAVVMETRPVGKTYLTQVDVKLDGRAAREDWGLGGEGNVTFGATLAYRSRILANDGAVVVEERTYQPLAAALVVRLDRLRFEFVNPRRARDAMLALLAAELPGAAGGARLALDWVLGELGVEIDDTGLAFNEVTVLKKNNKDVYAALRLDSLSGKTFRIRYRNDGTGIEHILPVDCEMLPAEEKMIRAGCYLFDAAFLDNGQRRVGDRWSVPAAVFGNLLAGTLEGDPAGELQLVRRPDQTRNDAAGVPRPHVILELDRDATGEIALRQVVRHDDGHEYEETGRLAGLEGTARFVHIPRDGAVPAEIYLHQLEARGLADVAAVSQDHLLFKARFAARPTLELRYLSFPIDAP